MYTNGILDPHREHDGDDGEFAIIGDTRPDDASAISLPFIEPEPTLRSSRYTAKIDAVSPESCRTTFEKEHDECFLGISLENSNFIRPKLTAILTWISRRFSRCTVLIGDSIHRITLETTKMLKPDSALEEALKLGKSFLDSEKHVFDSFGDLTKFSFVNSSEVQTWDAYHVFHDRLRALFAIDPIFRSSVESFGRKYHTKHSSQASDVEREQRISRSSDYFLEEFAVFSCIKQRGVGVMVYPGSFSTLAEIASGTHPGAPEELKQLVVVSLHMRGTARSDGAQRVQRGQIYQDVYKKRVDVQQASVVADLEHAWIEDGELHFATAQDRDRALTDGVFKLRIPPGFDFATGDAFAREFYKGKEFSFFGGFCELGPEEFGDPILGFHQRVNQVEQFLLERRFWLSHYPEEIAALGEALTQLSRQILRSVLTHASVPPELWRQATGGCSEAEGSYHLTFNHYRPQHEGFGLSSHKDDGFVTILRTTQPGLEVNRKDRWECVPIDPQYFIVNFGLSMAILTGASSRQVGAIMHRVSHQTNDRSSFGHFASSCCLPGSDRGVYRYQPNVGLMRVCASRELIDNNDYEIYGGTPQPEDRAS